MEFRVLGPLEVVDDGRVIPLAGARQRKLLAALVLRRGEAVSVGHLIEWLWGDDLPGNAANALQAQISQLRRALRTGQVIVTRSPGYLLDVPAEAVDAQRFETLLRSGRHHLDSGRIAEAVPLLHEALGLWRGEPLADIGHPVMVTGELTRLTELRLVAVEAMAEARLALGLDAELIPDLEAVLKQHPLRERLWAQLMTALYRSGRQADALRAYGTARSRLVDELGLEPGPELQALEGRILAQDPELLSAAVVRAAGGRGGFGVSTDVDPQLADSAPAPAPVRRGNLRHRLDRFVGRQDELVRLGAALDTARLVTLVGPGGVGKSRLAVEAAEAQAAAWPDGTWLVELASVNDAAALASAVSAALGVADTRLATGTAAAPEALIAAHIGGRSMLVVLDNCEHLAEAVAALVERLLAICVGLRILATSREQLFVPGEVPFHLYPLPHADAVALFEERARASRPDVDLTTSRATIAEICGRLDGLPLAVELAAARVRALSPAELADRLDDRFRILAGGNRTALPRHQTLRATIDWSHDLLTKDEQRLFRRLSVFREGFWLEAAEAICADEELDASEVLDLLTHLVDKSLVSVVRDEDGAYRYRQLQSLWDYGAERLAASGEADAVRERHTAWFRAFAGGIEDGLHGPDGPWWRQRVTAEIDNLRAALDDAVARCDSVAAFDIAIGVRWYFFVEGDWHAVIRWLRDALEVAGVAPVARRAQATALLHYFSAILEGPAAHVDRLEQAVEELRRLDAGRALIQGLHQLASIRIRAGEAGPVLAALEESAEVLTRFDFGWEAAMRFRLLATALARQDRLVEAEHAAREAVARFVAEGEQFTVLEAQSLLGDIAEASGDAPGAAALYAGIVEQAAQHHLAAYHGYFTLRLAGLRARLGDDQGADELYRTVPEVTRSLLIATASLVGRGAVARRAARRATTEGDRARCLAAAEAFYERARTDYAASGQADGEAVALAGLAWCTFGRGDRTRASELLAASRQRAAAAPHDPGKVALAAALAVEAALGEADDPAGATRRLQQVAALRAGGGWAIPAADEPDLAAIAERLDRRLDTNEVDEARHSAGDA